MLGGHPYTHVRTRFTRHRVIFELTALNDCFGYTNSQCLTFGKKKNSDPRRAQETPRKVSPFKPPCESWHERHWSSDVQHTVCGIYFFFRSLRSHSFRPNSIFDNRPTKVTSVIIVQCMYYIYIEWIIFTLSLVHLS